MKLKRRLLILIIVFAMVLLQVAPAQADGGDELGSNWERESLGGGQYQLTVWQKSIAYQDGNGAWTRITNALGATGFSAFPVGVDELVQLRIKDKLTGQSPVVHFGKGETHVRFTPLDTNNVDGVVDGNSITFPEAWENADLKLTIGGHRLQKDVILRTGHPESFAFRIDSHEGLDVETLSTANFRILPPILLDPDGLEDLPLEWAVTEQGGKTILTVTLPEGDWAGWTLDPTLTLQPDATDGLDALISSSTATTNYGTSAGVFIGDHNTSVSVRRELMQFDLSSLPDDAIISSSILSFYCFADNSSNARTYRVYRQKRDWVEAEATWTRWKSGNNWQVLGGFGANDSEQSDIGSRDFTATEALNEFKDFPLTPTTKAGLDLGNGWMIKADTELDDAYYFRSSDHAIPAQRPKLVVVYTVLGGGLTSGLSGLSGMSGMGG